MTSESLVTAHFQLEMEVCRTCRSFILQILLAGPEGVRSDRKIKLPRLHARRARNCWICYQFSQWLKDNDSDNFKTWQRRPLQVNISSPMRILASLSGRPILTPLSLDISPSSNGRTGHTCVVQLEFPSATDFRKSRPLCLASKRTTGRDLGVVDAWLRKCTGCHSKCSQNGAKWQPNRLIRLECGGEKAKLISSKDSRVRGHRYITLSHRWVEKSVQSSMCQPILKSDTLQQFQQSIDVDHLPKIFQEAIEITVHLGVQYLWIDSLCILQDDESDWEHEAKSLDKIYSSAYLNICAAMSVNGLESLLKPSSPTTSCRPVPIEFRWKGRLEKFVLINGGMWNEEIEDCPLLKRGWVFPERFLAHRVLHFGPNQMGWECQELAALQEFPNGFPQAANPSLMTKPVFRRMTDELRQSPGGGADDLEVFTEWQDLIQLYSKCAFTYGKDRLVALSGIAERLSRRRDDEYVEGMWRSSMIYDLPWWRPIESRKAFPIDHFCPRAGTWSWASADGEIEFSALQGGGVRDRYARIEEVITAQILGPMPLGLMPGGNNKPILSRTSIRIRGHLLPLRLHWRQSSDYDSDSNSEPDPDPGPGPDPESSSSFFEGNIVSLHVAHFEFFVPDATTGTKVDIEISDDAAEELCEGGKLMFLPLFASYYSMYGIVLAQVDGASAYRRVGSLDIEVALQRNPSTPTPPAGGGGMGNGDVDHHLQPDNDDHGRPGQRLTQHGNVLSSDAAVGLVFFLRAQQTFDFPEII